MLSKETNDKLKQPCKPDIDMFMMRANRSDAGILESHQAFLVTLIE